ncbi:hypothetical protein RvY_15274 [Ramazzottius varieornatus]|uniref:G-protein coupled receptors family 1 profile domain-containing protein n=1 Tax=Ramazzottius varieornatus TaxID=947166 RepID=A0A1D1W183_RAMVA|nr:hypothetical protein RvY_15274 [Ramazzottius varieornatus]
MAVTHETITVGCLSPNLTRFDHSDNSNQCFSGGNCSTAEIRSGSLTTDWLSAYIFLRSVAICTNLAFVLAVYADRTSKGGPRLLIGNLAMCSFLYCIILYPIYTLQEWLPPGEMPSSCTIIAPTMFFMAAISWADVSLSVNRTVAICFPLRYNNFRGYKITCALIAASWVISVFVPAVIGSGTGVNYVVVMLSSNSSFCTISTTNNLGAFSVGLCIPIPYAFIGMASLAIYCTAYVRMRNPPANASEAARRKRMINKRLVIVKAMLVSLLWNVVCSTPVLLTTSVPADDIRNQTLINNLEALTPGLLYALNPVSRRQAIKLVALKWIRKPSPVL